jgi:hypothetical protein
LKRWGSASAFWAVEYITPGSYPDEACAIAAAGFDRGVEGDEYKREDDGHAGERIAREGEGNTARQWIDATLILERSILDYWV